MLESENSLRIVVVLLEKSLKMSVYGNFLENGRVVGGRKKQNVWKGEVKGFGKKEKKEKIRFFCVRKIKKIKERERERGGFQFDRSKEGDRELLWTKEERKIKGVLSGWI